MMEECHTFLNLDLNVPFMFCLAGQTVRKYQNEGNSDRGDRNCDRPANLRG
jgi:hypothetical protein